MSEKGIMIVFPGKGYTCQEKLIRKIIQQYQQDGYKVKTLDFSSILFKKEMSLTKMAQLAMHTVEKQLGDINFEAYENIIFLAKSLGTICCTWYAEKKKINTTYIYLTPLPRVLQDLKAPEKVIAMVVGTEDRYISYQEMCLYAQEYHIPYLLIKGVGHSLKKQDDPVETEKIDQKILELCHGKLK